MSQIKHSDVDTSDLNGAAGNEVYSMAYWIPELQQVHDFYRYFNVFRLNDKTGQAYNVSIYRGIDNHVQDVYGLYILNMDGQAGNEAAIVYAPYKDTVGWDAGYVYLVNDRLRQTRLKMYFNTTCGSRYHCEIQGVTISGNTLNIQMATYDTLLKRWSYSTWPITW